jgi:tetratricopeptide (TPR) repeat protein
LNEIYLKESDILMMKLGLYVFLIIAFASNASEAYSQNHTEGDTVLARKYLESGISKYEKKDYSGALNDFDLSIQNNENSWKAYRYKGDALSGLQKYVEAIQDYSKALSLNNNDTLSYRGRADAYRISGNCKDALTDYFKAIQMNPNDFVSYFGRASCRYKNKEYEKSIEDYTKFIQAYPGYALAYGKRGMCYLDFKKYREAINDFNSYFKLDRDDSYGMYFYRGKSYLFLSDKDKSKVDSAIIDFENYLIESPKYAPAYKYLGFAYSRKNDSLRSRKNYQKSIELDPNSRDVYFTWGKSEYNFGNYSKAVSLFNKAIRNPENLTYDFYCIYADAKAGAGDTTGAIEAFGKAIAIDSNKYDAYENRYTFLLGDTNYSDLLIKDVNSLIRIEGDRDSTEVKKAKYYVLRSVVKFKRKDSTGTMMDINKAIELAPKDPSNYIIRAQYIYQRGGDLETILKDADKALSIDNRNVQAYFFKAAIYANFGEMLKSCESLRKGIMSGGKTYKEIEDYICRGKIPKDGIIPDMYFEVDVEDSKEDLNKKDIEQKRKKRSLKIPLKHKKRN